MSSLRVEDIVCDASGLSKVKFFPERTKSSTRKKIILLLPQTPKSIQKIDSKITMDDILFSYARRRTLDEILRDIEEFVA